MESRSAPSMLPVLFQIGGFEVRAFGVAMVLAFVASVLFAARRAPRFGLTAAQVSDLAFWSLVAGVLGARVFFVAQELPYYLARPDELFSLRFSGLTSFGGLLFGIGAIAAWARRRRVSVARVFDLVAPAFLVGHAVGRVGCLLNGCCFGFAAPASLPWAAQFADAPGLRHPAQVYDAAMNLAALGLVLAWEHRARAGQVFSAVLALHGLARFVYEFWRAGSVEQVRAGLASSTYWGSAPLTQAQAAAAALVLVGAVGFALFGRRDAPNPRLSTA